MQDCIILTIQKFKNDPHLLWAHLRHRSESRNVQRKLILTRKLSNVRMLVGSTVEEYCKLIDEILGQLASIDHTVPEMELMYIVLNGLPSDYESFVSNFSADLSKNPPPNFTDLVERLQSEEFWKLSRRTNIEEEVLFMPVFLVSAPMAVTITATGIVTVIETGTWTVAQPHGPAIVNTLLTILALATARPVVLLLVAIVTRWATPQRSVI